MTSIVAGLIAPKTYVDQTATHNVASQKPVSLSAEKLPGSLTAAQVISNKAAAPVALASALGSILQNVELDDAGWTTVTAMVTKELAEAQSTLAFDPRLLEARIAVLIVAISTMNETRVQAMKLKGDSAIASVKSSEKQADSMVKAGEAQMYAAITATVVASVMVVAGLSMSIKGQNAKRADIQFNQKPALAARTRADQLSNTLSKNSLHQNPTEKLTKLDMTGPDGKAKSVEFEKSQQTLNRHEDAVLGEQAMDLQHKASRLDLASRLEATHYEKTIAKGQALTAMAMVMSNTFSSVVGLRKFVENHNEVLAQSLAAVNKVVADQSGQRASDASTLQQKLMDVFSQILSSINSAGSVAATLLKA